MSKTKSKIAIPQNVRQAVWNTFIGEEEGQSKCFLGCDSRISQSNFHCGHIVAESKGGETIIENLRPICARCNTSIGTRDMKEFVKKFGMKPRGSLTKVEEKKTKEKKNIKSKKYESDEEESSDDEDEESDEEEDVYYIKRFWSIDTIFQEFDFTCSELKQVGKVLGIKISGKNKSELMESISSELVMQYGDKICKVFNKAKIPMEIEDIGSVLSLKDINTSLNW